MGAGRRGAERCTSGSAMGPSPLLSLVLLLAAIRDTSESLLCGLAEEVTLQARGRNSAVSLTLAGTDLEAVSVGRESSSDPCTLNIFAPHAYALSLRLIDAEDLLTDFGKRLPQKWISNKLDKPTPIDKRNRTLPDCTLNVFHINVNESGSPIPMWKITPCSADLKRMSSQVISPPIRIEWWPSQWSHRTDHLRLVVTAVNNGETCQEKDQITCVKAGLEPLLCISNALACDGVRHCPAGSSGGDDESKAMCNNQTSNWVQELIKRLATKHGDLLGVEMITSRPSANTTKRNVVEVTKEKTRQRKGLSALDAALEPYGTWGYLLLGMLICATVLIIFGVWECFCHYTRSPQDTVPPDCVAPAAICSSHPQHWRPYPPPNYDELELPPPAYSVLFPPEDKLTDILPGTSDQNGVIEGNGNVSTITTST